MEVAAHKSAACEVARIEAAIADIGSVKGRIAEVNPDKLATFCDKPYKKVVNEFGIRYVGCELAIFLLGLSAA